MQLQPNGERFVRTGLAVNDARTGIEMPENRSNREALVGCPRIFAHDPCAARTYVNRICDFVCGIVEAVQLDRKSVV